MAGCHKVGVSGWGRGSIEKWQALMRQGCVLEEREYGELAGSHYAGVCGWGSGSIEKWQAVLRQG